jgi:hypothetical protein
MRSVQSNGFFVLNAKMLNKIKFKGYDKYNYAWIGGCSLQAAASEKQTFSRC